MKDREFKHVSVMLKEVIDGLNIRSTGIYVDATIGGAGHSFEIARRLSSEGRLIGIDQDEAAIEAATERLSKFSDRVTIVRSNYSDIVSILKKLNIGKINGILLDLGVSSYQLDTKERGFSYNIDAPLDMRMDTRGKKTAENIVNDYSFEELVRILREYGEEKFAGKIAEKIVSHRENAKIKTTGELVEIIKSAIPVKYRITGGHPAKRTFQAIRIELNQELSVLKNTLDDMIDLLSDGGRIVVITFHSLEDRIVKNIFKRAEAPCTCPKSFPVCICGKKSKGRVVTKKPILPTEEEIEINKRSKSSKLRIFERMGG